MADNYIVSARKYRPQTFDTVVGQEHITTTLKNAIRHQHLAHAYLFCGPRGVGKTTCARILARTINCEHPTADIEACGVCPTCQSFKDNTSFNVFELDAASNNSVDDIRNLIDQVRFAPQQGKYKIYIIDEVHMLSAAAFNAFLKTLEEPPPYAIFILATTEKHKILPTILSRCQIFDFKRITTDDITAHLHSIATKESVVAQEAALHVIAQKSEGCMRDALSMLDRIVSFTNGMLTYQGTMEHLNLLDADFYFKLTDHLLSQDVSGTLLLLDQTLEKGFEGDVILDGLAEHLRNLLLCKDQRMAKLLDVPNEHKAVYYEKANQAPPSFILSALSLVNESELSYKNATNKRLHVEMCLIRLCYVLQAVSVSSQGQMAGAGVSDVKKNSDSVGFQAPSAPAVSNMPSPVQQAPAAAPQPASPVNNTPPPQPQPLVQPAVGNEALSAPRSSPSTSMPLSAPQTPLSSPMPLQEPTPSEYKQATPPPVQSTQGQMAGAEGSKPSSLSAPGSSQSPSRRINKGFMDLDNLNLSQQDEKEVKALTQESVQQVYDAYKQKIKDENKSMLHAQLCMMQVEALPPDEVRVVTPTDFTNTYAMDQRNALIEFYRSHTGIMVRVTTEVREDQEISRQQQTTVLSKPEMLEAMIEKNPEMGNLRDAMGLQIEY